MMHPKILIAEQEPSHAHLLQTELAAAGFQVVEAIDSVEAWRIIQEESLALVIIDAGLDAACRNLLLKIRTAPSSAKLPVLILGDAKASDQAIWWLNQGGDGYLSRFITPRLLVAQVRAKLRRVVPERSRELHRSPEL